MAAVSDHKHYLAVLNAKYDYEPQDEDEVQMKKGQILFLVDRIDEESILADHM
jgi:hypothetical protein